MVPCRLAGSFLQAPSSSGEAGPLMSSGQGRLSSTLNSTTQLSNCCGNKELDFIVSFLETQLPWVTAVTMKDHPVPGRGRF